jgi:acetate kinase
MSIDTFNHMVRFESGLLGVSGITGDMRALLAIEQEHKDAAIAIELFVRDIKKAIGALATTLGGIDSLIFSGGIGEQSAAIRARICQDLTYMGVEINEKANAEHAFLISAGHSRAGVHIIPTDEAAIIAAQTQELISKVSDR